MSEKGRALSLEPKYHAMEIAKAVIIAVIISLLLVLLSAFVIRLFNIGSEAVPIINQVIKSLSILLACLFSLRRPGCGWVRGLIAGLAYGIMAFCIFSLLSGGFVFDLSLLNDLVTGTASGLISGIISMAVRRN